MFVVRVDVEGTTVKMWKSSDSLTEDLSKASKYSRVADGVVGLRWWASITESWVRGVHVEPLDSQSPNPPPDVSLS